MIAACSFVCVSFWIEWRVALHAYGTCANGDLQLLCIRSHSVRKCPIAAEVDENGARLLSGEAVDYCHVVKHCGFLRYLMDGWKLKEGGSTVMTCESIKRVPRATVQLRRWLVLVSVQ